MTSAAEFGGAGGGSGGGDDGPDSNYTFEPSKVSVCAPRVPAITRLERLYSGGDDGPDSNYTFEPSKVSVCLICLVCVHACL